ncbi:MAG: hemerythrin family protein [Rhodospirillales bacterium]|nr:hemerythrin family protein [Rhodospirillales bacterium]MBO6788314.1 hemerythrin family protein [Rhodospirillales bacterium]
MQQDIPVWSETFETGIKAIDRDHKALFEEIGNLADALIKEQGPAEIEQAITCLETYVLEHFRREEGFMIQAGYPGTEEHLRKHRSLERKVKCLRGIHRGGSSDIDPLKLGRFLGNWLTGHILKTDMDYVPYLRGERDDQVPEQTALLNEVNVRVPANKRDVVERFVALLMSDDPMAHEITGLIETFESRLDDQEMAETRKLFCSDD